MRLCRNERFGRRRARAGRGGPNGGRRPFGAHLVAEPDRAGPISTLRTSWSPPISSSRWVSAYVGDVDAGQVEQGSTRAVATRTQRSTT